VGVEELKLTISHAKFYMILDLKKRVERWIGQSRPEEEIRDRVRTILIIIDKLVKKGLDVYVRRYKKQHYLFA
jgi:hypothetical protein